MIRIEDIIEKVSQNRPSANIDLLRRAYFFSALHHKGQKRASGEPYLIHPLAVADILADMRLDEIAVSTGLLHDVVEDTLVDLGTIRDYFGEEIEHIVDGLTKIASISNLSKEVQQAENVRKMVLAMTTDVRVVLVKLADRLHNMRTLDFVKPEKRQRIAQETLDIYAPIAHRLGMGKVRSELEDLSFRALYPEDYAKLEREVEARRGELEENLQKIRSIIEKKLIESDVPFVRIEGRVKRLYSLWRKMRQRKLTVDEVFDLIAVRVITPNEITHCYAALGIIHQTWHPVPSRFKDWIAIPRDNMYQSLHTSVVSESGLSFEVQIRTEEMHQIAEEGVAAHWKYKGGKLGARDDDQPLNALRSTIEKIILPLVETTKETEDSAEFIESLKLDLYPKDVYAFTPRGKVIQLPRGATTIDFAYAIHTQIGKTCTGAKINGRIVPIKTVIQNGDVVEILTNPNTNPSRDWLNHVVTSKARNQIRHRLAEQQRIEAVEIGHRLLEKELEKFQLSPKKVFADADGNLKKAANEYGLSRTDDLLASIGYGKIVPRNVVSKYLGAEKFTELDPEKKKISTLQSGIKAVKKLMRLGDEAIAVRGVDDLLVTRARCCNPLRGENIIGYISLGKGVVVHSKNCRNVPSLMLNKERIVEVDWAGTPVEKERFVVKMRVVAEDRPGILAALMSVIAEIKINIQSTSARTSDGRGIIDISIEVFDVRHLEKVRSALKSVSGVIDVERVSE